MLSSNVNEPAAQSWLAATQARFGADNDALVRGTRSLLDGIIAAPATHARLINTLSMLEHMGSHKIMSTQHAAGIDQATLKHVAEEAHHAYFMKRQAEKAAVRPLEYVRDDLLAPAAARMYFQRLEAAILKTLPAQRSAQAVYLYMSMIVEFRALWFYCLYKRALQHARQALSLKRMLGEEQIHLGDMASRLDLSGELSDTHAAVLLAYEKTLFARLLDALQRATA
jgi:hypothetical protein